MSAYQLCFAITVYRFMEGSRRETLLCRKVQRSIDRVDEFELEKNRIIHER